MGTLPQPAKTRNPTINKACVAITVNDLLKESMDQDFSPEGILDVVMKAGVKAWISGGVKDVYSEYSTRNSLANPQP